MTGCVGIAGDQKSVHLDAPPPRKAFTASSSQALLSPDQPRRCLRSVLVPTGVMPRCSLPLHARSACPGRPAGHPGRYQGARCMAYARPVCRQAGRRSCWPMHQADRASKSRASRGSAEAQRESAHYSWVQPGWLARRGVKVCASSRFSITALMRSCAQEAIPYSRPEDLYCFHSRSRSSLPTTHACRALEGAKLRGPKGGSSALFGIPPRGACAARH